MVPCPDCGISSEASDPSLSRWGCSICGWAYFLRRCSACGNASYVSALQGWHQPWGCVWCAASNTGFSQNRDPAVATIAELAADVTRHHLSPVRAAPARSEPAAEVTRPLPVVTATGMTAVKIPRAPRPRRRVRRILALAAAAAGTVAVAALVTAARPAPASPGRAAVAAGTNGSSGPSKAGGTTRVVSVTAQEAAAVDFQGVPGQMTVVAANTGRVTLTGQLHWSGRPPIVVTRLDRGAHVLLLSYQCAAASHCTESYRLTVPPDTALSLHQPPGQITLSGLAGPLSITASGVHVSATGLRSSTLIAMITQGDLSAGFAAPPSRVTVTLVSAQATLGLPRRAAYRISQQVTSGYVRADIPQDSTAARTVTARIRSGELTLQSS
jgi:hypothetical protein